MLKHTTATYCTGIWLIIKKNIRDVGARGLSLPFSNWASEKTVKIFFYKLKDLSLALQKQVHWWADKKQGNQNK